jgi:hypothetical protein
LVCQWNVDFQRKTLVCQWNEIYISLTNQCFRLEIYISLTNQCFYSGNLHFIGSDSNLSITLISGKWDLDYDVCSQTLCVEVYINLEQQWSDNIERHVYDTTEILATMLLPYIILIRIYVDT